jgi:hypothetical protein
MRIACAALKSCDNQPKELRLPTCNPMVLAKAAAICYLPATCTLPKPCRSAEGPGFSTIDPFPFAHNWNNFMLAKANPKLPKFVGERLSYLARQVRLPPIVHRVLTRQFTDAQRKSAKRMEKQWAKRMGPEGAKQGGPDIIQIWAKLHDVDPVEAVIEIARTNNFLFPDEAQQLLRYFGNTNDHKPQAAAPIKPDFGQDGRLRFGKQLIREVPLRLKARTKPELLLRAFQDSQWSAEIDNPFPKKEIQYLYNAVRVLNKKLDVIRFEVRRGGTRVAWVKIGIECEV